MKDQKFMRVGRSRFWVFAFPGSREAASIELQVKEDAPRVDSKGDLKGQKEVLRRLVPEYH